mgnify:CR=1 FL=1
MAFGISFLSSGNQQPPSSQTTVSFAAVRDLIDLCKTKQLPIAPELLAANARYLQEPGLRVPEDQVVGLWQQLASTENSAGLGVQLGQVIKGSSKGLLASWVSQAETLGEALSLFRNHIELMNPSEHWRVEHTDNVCTLTFTLAENCNYPSIAIERSMSAMVAWGQSLCGKPLALVEATFSFSEPVNVEIFKDVFGSKVNFNGEKNTLKFESEVLEYPIGSHNNLLKSMVGQAAQASLVSLKTGATSGPVGKQVEKIINQNLENGESVSIDLVANELATSRQSLYRQLRKENTNFKDLFDSLRKQRSIDLLSNPNGNITSVSYQLGFGDLSSFYKAFRRWYGTTPADYLTQVNRPD